MRNVHAYAAMRLVLALSLALASLCGCAPRVEENASSGKAAGGDTTTTVASAPATTSTSAAAQASTASIEWHAQPPPPGYKLPFPDAWAATDIEPGKRGGTFTIVTLGDPKTFDPITANENTSTEIIGRMFDSLIGFDPVKEMYFPGLLKEYYMEDDKRNWILRLRSGLKWSDGQPITADDIMFSIKVVYDPKIVTPSKDTLQVAGKPIEFEKLDDLTVRAKLAQPSGCFHVMAASIPVVPKHALEETYKAGKYETALNIDVAPEKVVCSGPYKLKQYLSGQRTILERNPHYYKYDKNGTQLPYLDTLVFSSVPDMDTMMLRFQRGESDVLTTIRPESVFDMRDGQTKGNYKLYELGPGDTFSVFWFNLKQGNSKSGKPFLEPVKQAWFNDEKFRKAILYAMNKDAIINSVLRGLAVNVWSQEPPVNRTWHNPNVPKYEYDLKKANAMLDELGFKDRNGDGIREDASGRQVEFTFITNKGNKVREEVAALLAADLKAAGILARPQFMDFNALVTLLNDTYQYEGCLLGFGGALHPSTSMNTWRSNGRTHFIRPMEPKPVTQWEAEIDKLCNDFTTELDLQKQRDIYFRMQEIFAEHCGNLPLWTAKVHVALRNGFGNVKMTATSTLWNLDEYYRTK